MLMDEIRTEPAQCPPAERPAGISILELTSATCRWPLWGFRERPVNGGLYCGAPVAGADVYCEGHCAMTGRAPKPLSTPAPARVALRPSESRTAERGPQVRLSRPVLPRQRLPQVEDDVASWRERYGAARRRLAPAVSAPPSALVATSEVVPPAPVAPPAQEPPAPVPASIATSQEVPVAAPAPGGEERRRKPEQFVPCPAPPARAMATPCGNGRALVRMMARHGLGPRVTVEDVLRAVCQRYDVRRIDLISERRTAGVLLPRQVAMYLARDLTTSSLPKIGYIMSGRDHTTILHGYQVIKARMAINPELARDVAALACTISATAVERSAAERRWGGAE